ncbi:Phenylalanine-4-hydroxylase [Bienertia sinuspersici]
MMDSLSVLVLRPLPDLNKKIVLWNIRGRNGDEFILHALEIISKHKPTIFIFLTKADELRGRQIQYRLGFQNFRYINPHGKPGGVWLFWQSIVNIVLFNDGNVDFFHALFHFIPDQPEVLLTGLHAMSSRILRAHFWRGMQDNLPPLATPWLVMGDMNEVTNQGEKKGGRTFRHA